MADVCDSQYRDQCRKHCGLCGNWLLILVLLFSIMYASLSLYVVLCMLRYSCISYYTGLFVVPVFRIFVPVFSMYDSLSRYFVLCMLRCTAI